MTAEPHPSSITFTFLLDGKSVCGQEHRPDRCEDCSEMPNCVLDCFYDALSKQDGCDSSAKSAGAELDDIAQWIEKHTRRCRSLRMAVVMKYELLDFLKELRGEQR